MMLLVQGRALQFLQDSVLASLCSVRRARAPLAACNSSCEAGSLGAYLHLYQTISAV